MDNISRVYQAPQRDAAFLYLRALARAPEFWAVVDRLFPSGQTGPVHEVLEEAKGQYRLEGAQIGPRAVILYPRGDARGQPAFLVVHAIGKTQFNFTVAAHIGSCIIEVVEAGKYVVERTGTGVRVQAAPEG